VARPLLGAGPAKRAFARLPELAGDYARGLSIVDGFRAPPSPDLRAEGNGLPHEATICRGVFR